MQARGAGLYLIGPEVERLVHVDGLSRGAVATHVRVGHPLFSHTLFPVYVAALVWGGLFLRESRLRALIPLRR